MRTSLVILLAFVVSFLSAVPALGAQTFHVAFLRTNKILSFTGNLIVPDRIPSRGTPYLWPGLQPGNSATVLQPVLDGRNRHWWFGNALVGRPSGPYGGGVGCGPGNLLGFNMTNINGAGNWYISSSNGPHKAEYTYNIGVQMQAALFAVELYPNTPWDFGNLVFKDVLITATGTDRRWCTANMASQLTRKTVSGVSSWSANGITYCRIGSLTLAPP